MREKQSRLYGIANPPADGLRMAHMPTVAEQLRTAREARKLTIHEIAETTKIRTDHLRALESGDYDMFTAPVYIRGFVRTYATLLKLEVPQVMSALDAELGQTEKFSEPPPLSAEPRGALDFLMLQLSRVNWQKGLVAIIGAVVVLIVLVWIWAWRKHRSADPLSDLPRRFIKPRRNNPVKPCRCLHPAREPPWANVRAVSHVLQVQSAIAPQIEEARGGGEHDRHAQCEQGKCGRPWLEQTLQPRPPFHVRFQHQQGDDRHNLGDGLVLAVSLGGQDDTF